MPLIAALPSIDALRVVFDYDPETGMLLNRQTGNSARCPSNGYFRAYFPGGRKYLVHRIAWKIGHGVEPGPIIDHIDRNKQNNRLSNLREASPLLSTLNRAVHAGGGFKGFSFDAERGCYRPFLNINGARRILGSFVSEGEARAAYMGAVKALKIAGQRQAISLEAEVA